MDYKYEQCYVAFLDILGFREMIREESCEDIFNLFSAIDNKNPGEKLTDSNIYNCLPFDKVGKIVMSDSVILFVETSVENSLGSLIVYCCVLANSLLRREKPVLVRGGIAKGEFYHQNNHFYGGALNLAYELQEKIARYPRIIMFEKLEKDIVYYNDLINKFLYKENDGFLAIDSLMHIKKDELELLRKVCEDSLNKYIDFSIREKYLYLKNRLDSLS